MLRDGFVLGEAKGKAEGEAKGEIRAILRLRFKEVPQEIKDVIQSMTDLVTLSENHLFVQNHLKNGKIQ